MKSRNVLFVTGAFVTHHCWDEWKAYFEAQGYTCKNPPWPFKNGTAAELRARRPNDTDLATLTLSELTDSYADAARTFPEKPIIIGHSLGGLITQILINRGLGAAGVAIHPLGPQGIIPYEFSFLKAGWKALGLLTSLKKTYMMSFPDWQYAFVNGLPLEEQKAAYDRFTIPESKTVTRGGLTSAAAVDWDRPHAPLLITAGSTDHIIPASLNRRNYERYNRSNGSILEYKEFEGRNHFVLGQHGWQGDADYILDWLEKVLAEEAVAV